MSVDPQFRSAMPDPRRHFRLARRLFTIIALVAVACGLVSTRAMASAECMSEREFIPVMGKYVNEDTEGVYIARFKRWIILDDIKNYFYGSASAELEEVVITDTISGSLKRGDVIFLLMTTLLGQDKIELRHDGSYLDYRADKGPSYHALFFLQKNAMHETSELRPSSENTLFVGTLLSREFEISKRFIRIIKRYTDRFYLIGHCHFFRSRRIYGGEYKLLIDHFRLRLPYNPEFTLEHPSNR